MSRRRRGMLGVVAVTAALSVAGVWAAESLVPADLQANILLRMLGYDRSLKGRAGASIGIAVLFKAGDKDSTLWHDEMLRAFEALQPQTIQGVGFAVQGHRYKDPASLADFVAKKGIDAIYLTPGLEAETAAVRALCDEKKVSSVAASRSAVEQGIAVAVVAKGDTPRLLVNLRAAQAAGMELDPKLLQLSEVLR